MPRLTLFIQRILLNWLFNSLFITILWRFFSEMLAETRVNAILIYFPQISQIYKLRCTLKLN